MKVLVTGAAGRVGSATTTLLLERGHDVRATDRRRGSALPASVPLEYADLCDPLACYRLAEGVEAVVHLGNHPRSVPGQAQRVFAENGAMNVNIFTAAAELGVPRVLFASSIQAVMGHVAPRHWRDPSGSCKLPYLPIDSRMPMNPANEYGASKAAAEILLQMCCQARPMTGIALRLPVMWKARVPDLSPEERAGVRAASSEAMSYLRIADAADLIDCALRAAVTGYHCYLPADYLNTLNMPAREAYETHLSNAPLRVPIQELHTLVDCTQIERDLGWRQPGKARALSVVDGPTTEAGR